MASQDWSELGEGSLYLKSTFGSDSYSIWATDLSQLHIEQLDVDDLRWRARKDKIPIDLDEAHNLSTLLKHLSSAAENGELSISSSSKTRYLELSTTIRLPKPLPEFQWVFKLELQSDEKFREHVTKPMLTEIRDLGQREEDLVHRIQDKDHVIDRLLGILDKHSVNLGDVFPTLASQASSRRPLTRSDAESFVPALQPFERNAWQNGVLIGKYHQPTASVVSQPSVGVQPEQVIDSPKKSQASNGAPKKRIQRTLGRRAPTTPAREILDPTTTTDGTADATTDDETPEKIVPPIPDKPKGGIKRTLGRRHVSPAPAAYADEVSTPPSIRHAQNENQDTDGDAEVEAERLTDEKRKALKRELENAAALRPKKRKF